MPLHDIFPALDNTWNYVILGGMVLCAYILIILTVWRLKRRKKKKNRRYYLNLLDQCDFNDSKKVAYWLSYYGHSVVRTTEEEHMLNKLTQILNRYKYAQKSTTLPLDLQVKVKKFLAQLRERHV